jgi:hypothetical protein
MIMSQILFYALTVERSHFIKITKVKLKMSAWHKLKNPSYIIASAIVIVTSMLEF